jgi:hypothetical protein
MIGKSNKNQYALSFNLGLWDRRRKSWPSAGPRSEAIDDEISRAGGTITSPVLTEPTAIQEQRYG